MPWGQVVGAPHHVRIQGTAFWLTVRLGHPSSSKGYLQCLQISGTWRNGRTWLQTLKVKLRIRVIRATLQFTKVWALELFWQYHFIPKAQTMVNYIKSSLYHYFRYLFTYIYVYIYISIYISLYIYTYWLYTIIPIIPEVCQHRCSFSICQRCWDGGCHPADQRLQFRQDAEGTKLLWNCWQDVEDAPLLFLENGGKQETDENLAALIRSMAIYIYNCIHIYIYITSTC